MTETDQAGVETRLPPIGPTIRGLLQLVVVLQIVIIVGIAVVYLQLAGLPDQVAQRVPTDGGAAAGMLPTIESKIDAMQVTLDELAQARPSPSP